MSHILLIEDDRWLAELYSTVFASDDRYNVTTAHCAADGLAVFGSDSSIDLIILDMVLPDHNGVEFLHEIASYEDSGKVPIIILSSLFPHDFQMPQERWKQYGVIDYLYKPTTRPKDLLNRVKKHFAKAQA